MDKTLDELFAEGERIVKHIEDDVDRLNATGGVDLGIFLGAAEAVTRTMEKLMTSNVDPANRERARPLVERAEAAIARLKVKRAGSA